MARGSFITARELATLSILLCASLAPVACDSGRLAQPRVDVVGGVYVVTLSPGVVLEQRLSVAPSEPLPRQSLRIESWLRNASRLPVQGAWSICGLHLQHAEQFLDITVRCGGYSAHGVLAPGDSVFDRRDILAPELPGTYQLEVRQLVEPSVWIPLTVVVRQP